MRAQRAYELAHSARDDHAGMIQPLRNLGAFYMQSQRYGMAVEWLCGSLVEGNGYMYVPVWLKIVIVYASRGFNNVRSWPQRVCGQMLLLTLALCRYDWATPQYEQAYELAVQVSQ